MKYRCRTNSIENLIRDNCRKYSSKRGAVKGKSLSEILQLIEASVSLEMFHTIAEKRKNRFHFHSLDNQDGRDYTDCWGIAVSKKNETDRLVIKPDYDPLPITDDGLLKMKEIFNIVIWNIDYDYHKKK